MLLAHRDGARHMLYSGVILTYFTKNSIIYTDFPALYFLGIVPCGCRNAAHATTRRRRGPSLVREQEDGSRLRPSHDRCRQRRHDRQRPRRPQGCHAQEERRASARRRLPLDRGHQGHCQRPLVHRLARPRRHERTSIHAAACPARRQGRQGTRGRLVSGVTHDGRNASRNPQPPAQPRQHRHRRPAR